MAWTTLLASQTDADSPLNQLLFDAIRENLNYLKNQTDALACLPLGGSVGETSGVNGTEVDLGGAFHLAAPPSGKKWRLHVKIQGKKTAGTINLRLKLYDKTDTQLQFADSPNLTASYVDYELTLDVTTAIWGRLAVHYWGSGTAQSRNGAARAYLVDA